MINKKKVSILVIIFITLSAVVGIKLKTTAAKKEMELNQIAKTLINEYFYSKIINDISYQPLYEGIVLDVKLTDSFATLSSLEQFAYLDAYCKSLRNYINTSKQNSESGQKDIILTSSNLGDVYKYHSTCWKNDVKMKSYYGTLYMNDEQQYCQEQYKAYKSNYNDSLEEEFFNGYSDLEIMKYTVSIFNLITYGGEIRTLESDNKQITDEVTERFGITQDDFRKIYMKYYYQYSILINS